MEVRIKFSADLVITGDTMEQVRSKFENMPLWSDEAKACGVEFSEIQLVEDANTYNDLEHEYNHCYDMNGEKEEYVCPDCGHVFEQGESNYNYDTGHTDYECPECGWCGNEHEVIEDDDDDL
jgi:DNA-directed RNA polymerase subunit RPC12/RpoP